MIRQIRILGLGVLAVVTVGVVMSASASAHEFFVCREGGTEKYESNSCSKKKETGKFSFLSVAGTEKDKVEGTSGTAKLESKFSGQEEIIECNKDVFSGEIAAAGVATGMNTFSECKMYQVGSERHKSLVDCTIPNLITNETTDKLVTGQGSGPEDEIQPQAGDTLLEFTISGQACALYGRYTLSVTEVETLPAKQKVRGQLCALPEAAVGKVEHEIVCTSTGSHLTFATPLGGGAASFSSTERVKLASGASWAAE